MKLTSINEVREIMDRYGLRFNKGYGQNFLINDSVPVKISENCGADSNSGILEIGPGIGTLTCELCKRFSKVVAVEIDSSFIPPLSELGSVFDNLTVINGDIMKTDIPLLIDTYFADMNVSVCANLPYYITTPIIMRLLESGCAFDNITVMVQKEVAQRLCSLPGESEYGAITASVRRYGTVSRLFTVSAGSFIPAPKVDSAVIRIKLDKRKSYSVSDERLMSRVIRGAFAQRRKTLVNSLCSEFHELSKSDLARAIADSGLEPDVRGETLDTDRFALLSDKIFNLLEDQNDNR